MSVQEQVMEFHRVFVLDINLPVSKVVNVRTNLIREECIEVLEALVDGDLSKIAHELADLVYVVYGTAVALGIEIGRAHV